MTDWDRDVRRYFDALGDAEWSRLEQDLRSRVSLEIHRRFLRRLVVPGSAMLEIGAGAGRFTIELARLGTSIVVTDVSTGQLEVNARRCEEAAVAYAVVARCQADVRDLSQFATGTFDGVLAFGGPLSYAFEGEEVAFEEMLRVVRPGGLVIASVMSLLGSTRYFLPGVVNDIAAVGLVTFNRVIDTGDSRGIPGAHLCRMFRWSEIEALIGRFDCSLVAASASNWASLGDADALATLHQDEDLWAAFLDWEEGLCAERGALDGGTHTLFAVRKDLRV